jgi:hypothetical protein
MRQTTYPRRPPRLVLFSNVHPFYFLTFNTYNRLHLLAQPEIHDRYRLFCQRAERDHRVAVGRYVIMLIMYTRLSGCHPMELRSPSGLKRYEPFSERSC